VCGKLISSKGWTEKVGLSQGLEISGFKSFFQNQTF